MGAGRLDLAAVRMRFSEWRAARPRRRPIPDGLWRAAARLVDAGYSASTVCRELRLNPSRLKEAREMLGVARSGSRSMRRRRGAEGDGFVALPPLVSWLSPTKGARPGECRIHLEGPSGLRVLIDVLASDVNWVGSLCRALVGAAGAGTILGHGART